MSIEATIEGNASQQSHVAWIPLESVKLPTERDGVNTAPGNVTDRTTNQVDFKDVEISKGMDKASPNLMKWNISGATYKVTIDICKEDGQVVLQMILFDTLLTNYDSEANEEGQVTENLSLDYTKISMEFISYKKDNTEDRRDTVIYDLETASGAS
ncbi:MAG: type VI secretion system tube protein Hcp [Planctomycetes bacterium]|nr:type VI secretion system tube protein Hcp [Planctomycetota bacterium]